MKATLLLENVLGKLSFLNSAVSSKTNLPALSGVLISIEKGKAKFSTTDLEIGAVVQVPASVEEEGGALVLARPLSEFLASVGGEKITIETKGEGAVFSTDTSRATFAKMDEGGFPKILEERGEKITTFEKTKLENAISLVSFAAAQDPSRPAFSSVFLKFDKKECLMVATDSHRLSKKTISPTNTTKPLSKPILATGRTIRTFLTNKEGDDVSVFVSDKQNQIVFEQKESVLTGRLIDAEYPDFEKIIPQEVATRAEFDRGQMQQALKTASIFARDNANIVKISIRKGRILIFAKSPTIGEETMETEAKTEGEENEIAFNARYISELLQNIQEDTVAFEMQGPLNPGVFKIKGDDSFIHLIMPIRVKEEEL